MAWTRACRCASATGASTVIAWGHYTDYLDGRFDGRTHWDETQEARDGQLMLHGGRDTPYIAPTETYAGYLAHGVLHALDSGAEAVYLEEPEFWAQSGWSTPFKAAWVKAYGIPWQAPDSSPQAQWRASRLKYALYGRTVAGVCASVHEWAARHRREVPCNIATHSLLNYAQWHIVSPKTSFQTMHPDGFIGQVWTGTAQAPNSLDGVEGKRTLETAFLEYGFLSRLAIAADAPIWMLADPVEDNPHHAWEDYEASWKTTLVASLMHPSSARYEVLPWPNRVFDLDAIYTVAAGGRSGIPANYQVVLQIVFDALEHMPLANASWLASGTQGVGVLVSDNMMFQRAGPAASDQWLGDVYGLALPLLSRGIPVVPVPMESTYAGTRPNHALDGQRLLLLSFHGQMPPSARFTQALVAWVREGGALAVIDDDRNSYAISFAPRQHLFKALGLNPYVGGINHVGRGVVAWLNASPAALSHQQGGAGRVLAFTHALAAAADLPWSESTALVMRRGNFVVAAGLPAIDGSVQVSTVLHGRYVDLLDASLTILTDAVVKPGQVGLFRDIGHLDVSHPQILAASGKATALWQSANALRFSVKGVEGRPGDYAMVALALPWSPTRVKVDGYVLASSAIDYRDHVLRLRLPARAALVPVEVDD